MALKAIQKFAGKHVVLTQTGSYFYIPSDEDDFMEYVVEDLHPEEVIEDGWEAVAVGGAWEGGELVQWDSFLAINEDEDRAYISDEGSIEFIDVPASALIFELDPDENQ